MSGPDTDRIEFGPWRVWLRGDRNHWYVACYSELENAFIVDGPFQWQTSFKPDQIEKRELL